MSENKQRLTKLAPKEKAAANTGGVLDESIPEQEIIKYLNSKHDTVFDTALILETVANRAGWYRLMQERPDIEPKARAQQARDTAAVIHELMDRLESMHPDVAAYADELLWRSDCELVCELAARINPDLLRLKLVLAKVADTMDSLPSKAGPKPKVDRDSAYTKTFQALKSHSHPALSDAKAREYAAELLRLCSIETPTDESDQRRIIKGGG